MPRSSISPHRALSSLLLWALCATPVLAELPDHPAVSRAPLPGWVDVLPFEEIEPEEPPQVELATSEAMDSDDLAAAEADPQDPEETEQLEDDPDVDEQAVSDVRFLLQEDQVYLPRRGPATRFSRFVYRIESRSALESWSSWERDFAADDERLRLHHLRIRRDGRWSDRLRASQASILQREAGLDENIFDETQTLHIVLDDVRVGDVVDVAWSKEGGNPVFGESYFDSYRLGWRSELDRRRLIVDHAGSRGLRYRSYAGAADPLVKTDNAGRRVRWTWDLRQLPALETESWVPDGTWQLPWVELSDVGSWSEVREWAAPLWRTDPTSPAIRPVLEEIGQSLDDEATAADYVRAARDWVQNEVRYFAHLMGPHSHTPHAPADILRRRYGDCKDKSFLLLHLLHARGLDAWPVFVHSRNGDSLDQRLPGAGAFDHAIIATRLPASREGGEPGTLFIDPTLTLQGGGPSYVPHYGWGLEIRPDADGLSRVEASKEARGRIEAVYRYDVPAEGQVTEVEIVTTYSGGEAESQRRSMDGRSPEDILDGYVTYYTTDRIELEAREALQISDDRDANQIEIVERYWLTYVPADEQDLLRFDSLPRLMESQNLPDPPEEDEEREHGLYLPHPVHLVEIIELESEEAFVWNPIDLTIDEPWLRYRAESVGSDGEKSHQTSIRYEMETLADRVAVEDLEPYREALETIEAHIGYWIRGADELFVDEDLQRHALRVLTIALGLLTVLAFVSFTSLRLRDLL